MVMRGAVVILLAGICAWSADAAPRRPARKPPPAHAPAAAGRSPELERLKVQYEAAEAKQASFAAARIARQGVALAVQATGPDSTDSEVWRNRLINALIRTGDSAGSVAVHKDVLASAERRYGLDSRQTLIAVEMLRSAYPSNSHFEERDALMQRELKLTEKRYGERSIQYAEALDHHADLLRHHGEYSAQIVVLSACETGVGKVTNGDGVYGLRRALVIAGAESLVMSLWPVDDEATRDLMAGFYARLATGAPRSSALRAIQLAILARPRYAHPFYWASFLPTGDDTPLQ